MKIKFFNILLLCFCSLRIFPQSVSQEQAIQIAEKFFVSISSENTPLNQSKTQSQTLHQSVAKVKALGKKQQPAMYAVSDSNNWVLVSGDERVTPILAYSDENGGEFPDDNDMPPAMIEILEWYESQIEYLRDSTNFSTIHPHWLQLNGDEDVFAKTIIVYPLLYRNGLENKWGQSGNNSGNAIEKSYNKFCPLCNDTQHSLVGCVAVATGQIMWYWQWPIAAVVKDDDANYHIRDYDWSLMPYQLTNSSSLDEVDMVANLLHDVGVSVKMDYGCTGSGAYTYRIVTALRETYNYNADNVVSRSSFTNEAWLQMLKNELMNNRPILYSGVRSGHRGHQFVLDGYNSANEFHVNYGWKGSSNGFYLLDTIRNGTDPYKYSQNAILNVHPNYPSCSAIEIQPTESWQTNFAIFNGGAITIGNRTINSNQKGVIYSGDKITLTSGFQIEIGAEVHIAIRDINCEEISSKANISRNNIKAKSRDANIDITNNSQVFSIAPNPVHDNLIINTKTELTNIFIYNPYGQCVLQTKQLEINVSALPVGIYILTATTIKGEKLQVKFIKQ